MRTILLAALVLTLACGDSSDSNGNPAPLSATIFQLQNGDVDVGREVEVLAYISAISSDGSRVWLSDGQIATARTGIEVFRGNSPSALNLSVGDRVIVTGTLQEFGQGAGLTVTQLADPGFTLETAATLPITPVTGLSLNVITQDPIPGATANGEAYEGVMVQVEQVEVTSTSPFTLSDGANVFAASSQVIALNDPVGTCYETVTGIWNYDVNTDHWIIVPVTAGLVAGGTCDS